jgi:hypothetical protein
VWPACTFRIRSNSSSSVIYLIFLIHHMPCYFLVGFPAKAEMRKGVAQWSAGDLHQSLERAIHLQNQEDRT